MQTKMESGNTLTITNSKNLVRAKNNLPTDEQKKILIYHCS